MPAHTFSQLFIRTATKPAVYAKKDNLVNSFILSPKAIEQVSKVKENKDKPFFAATPLLLSHLGALDMGVNDYNLGFQVVDGNLYANYTRVIGGRIVCSVKFL